MPSFAAVAGLISTQLLHMADVIGSGISCSQGRCASEPSRNWFDEYGRKWNGYCPASPSNLAVRLISSREIGTRAGPAPAVTVLLETAAGRLPHQPPFSCASVQASLPSVMAGSAAK